MSAHRHLRAAPLALLAALALGLSACASVTGSGTARTLDKGQTQLGAGFELGLGLPKLSPEYHAPLLWPQFVAGIRHGFSERVDGGARVWGFGIQGLYTAGAQLDTKIALHQADSRNSGTDYTLAPSASYHQVNFGHAPNHSAIAQLPLLIGFNLPGEAQATVGPRVGYQGVFSAGQHPVHLIAFGSNFAVSADINDRITLVPEFVLLYSPVSFNGTVDGGEQRGLTIMQLGLGFQFDL